MTDIENRWLVWIDTGGTFTDCLAVDPQGETHRVKVLSDGTLRAKQTEGRLVAPWLKGLEGLESISDAFLEGFTRTQNGDIVTLASGKEAPLLAAHLVTKTPLNAALPPMDMRLATTRGTNALLTRQGIPPVLFLTRGFRDLLAIGTQQRPNLFALDIPTPTPLYAGVVEINARMAATGEVFEALDSANLRAEANKYLAAGHTHAAICLMHADRFPMHEQEVMKILLDMGFVHLSVSSELAPFVRVLPRAQTTLVNAYLAPVIETYKNNVQAGLAPNSTLFLMTSAGGLVAPTEFHPKDSLLSGPAGGVVGAIAIGKRAGYTRVIGFDMGGTSTDVCRLEIGETDSREYAFEHTVGDVTLFAPSVMVESVAAGGGSLCQIDAMGNLTVGPRSAGAFPGPACYGQGGPLTITDVNLLLGHLNPDAFEVPLDIAAAQAALTTLLPDATTHPRSLALWREIANETMASAIRTLTTRRGKNPADYALLAFGGAGGQHACAIAEKLGIQAVLFPQEAGLLSAYGLGHAVQETITEQQILAPLGEFNLPETQQTQQTQNSKTLIRLRLKGQEACLTMPYNPDHAQLKSAFREAFIILYGYPPDPYHAIEVESLRIITSQSRLQNAINTKQTETRFATLLVPPHWHVSNAVSGVQILTSAAQTQAENSDAQELFLHRFTQIATQMGETLQRTALSVNVKERLDFSCTLLSPNGDLVATAAHIPVHLGALGVCVRRVCETIPTLEDGDVVLTNHPAFGGSHLPDLTLVTPVFAPSTHTLLGYVASRAHHAEIGGTRPGSMPPNAKTLAEEGVVIAPTYLLKAGVPEWHTIENIFIHAPYPTRQWAENRADLEAMIAANTQGARALQSLAAQFNQEILFSHQENLASRAEQLARNAIAALDQTPRKTIEQLDDGTLLCVTVTPQKSRLMIDFTGTGDTHPGNLNAPPAVVMACVLYVLRLLISEEMPLNEGLLRAVDLILPEGTLVNPRFHADPTQCPAVVGGNTEVSQRIVTLLLRALNLAADSQTTMNNVLFGNDRFGYYETLGGGAGATQKGNGRHAVHTHMTNTRLTDPELLEVRYPVRVERFERREGSGGAGKHSGGDGLERELVFLEAVSVSVLTQNRTQSPQGLAGGEAGKPGYQHVIRPDGSTQTLSSVDGCECEAGDRFVIATPGGGGYGSKAT
jgi:5-oxoprolinase (ATP-hydrolysing)